MRTYTIEFDATELVKLIAICNSAIVIDEATLEHLPSDSKGSEACKLSIAKTEALKQKIKNTILDSLEGRCKANE